MFMFTFGELEALLEYYILCSQIEGRNSILYLDGRCEVRLNSYWSEPDLKACIVDKLGAVGLTEAD